MTRVLLAGGGGFIGSHLTERLLDAGYDVIVVDSHCSSNQSNLDDVRDHPGLSVVEQDVLSPLQVQGPFDLVVHLASRASPPDYQEHPVHTLRTNSEGTLRLLRVAEQNDARFVYASTSEVYGDPDEHPQREEYNGNVNPVGPRACYDEAKRYGEALVTSYAREHDVSYSVARIFNTYGPRLRKDDGRVVSTFIWQALNDDDLTVYGDGSQTRSFCYVDDLVTGIQALTEYDENIICNLGNPAEKTILDLAKTVQTVVDTSSSVVYEPLPEDDPSQRKPDITRAQASLGWTPSVSLENGLERTADWFRDAYE